MFRSRLSKNYESNGVNTTPKSRKYSKGAPSLGERKLAVVGLILSLVVIAGKLYYLNYEAIHKIVFEKKLVSYKVLSENGEIMFTNTWQTAVRYSNLWLPFLCGFLTTYFTWMCVYLDSNVPGVNPPSPFSPQKYRARSGHTFHINYVFAVLVGLLVSTYMYYKGVSIQY